MRTPPSPFLLLLSLLFLPLLPLSAPPSPPDTSPLPLPFPPVPAVSPTAPAKTRVLVAIPIFIAANSTPAERADRILFLALVLSALREFPTGVKVVVHAMGVTRKEATGLLGVWHAAGEFGREVARGSRERPHAENAERFGLFWGKEGRWSEEVAAEINATMIKSGWYALARGGGGGDAGGGVATAAAHEIEIIRVGKGKLDNPHMLTWEHRGYFASRLDSYDFFMYNEGDVELTYPAFTSWLRDEQLLYPTLGLHRTFFRFQTNTPPCANNLTLIDQCRLHYLIAPDLNLTTAHSPKLPKALGHGRPAVVYALAAPSNTSRRFAALSHPYAGMWIGTSDSVRRFMDSCPAEWGVHAMFGLREGAAFGDVRCFYGGGGKSPLHASSVVPLDGAGGLEMAAGVWHVANNKDACGFCAESLLRECTPEVCDGKPKLKKRKRKRKPAR